MADLTDKQRRFVEEYLIDLNATAAAERAGYSDGNYGRQLITKPNVAAAISKAIEKRSRRTEITQDRVLQELARIGFADIRNLFEWDEQRTAFVPSRNLTEDEAAAIGEVRSETILLEDGATKLKLKLKTYDKLSALEKLGKHLGLFVDRIEHTGADGGPIEYRDVTDAELQRRATVAANRLAALTGGQSGNGRGKGNGRNG